MKLQECASYERKKEREFSSVNTVAFSRIIIIVISEKIFKCVWLSGISPTQKPKLFICGYSSVSK